MRVDAANVSPPGLAPVDRARASAGPTDATSGGAVVWVRGDHAGEICARLTHERYVVAATAGVAIGRGGLRRALDDAVESALARKGALPPTVDADTELSRIIRDQVFRAHALGGTGLALVLPPLAPLADREVSLDPDDGAALRAWIAAARAGGVALVLDESSRSVRLLAPVELGALLQPPSSRPPPPISVACPPTEAPAALAPRSRAPAEPEAPGRVVSSAEWRAHAVELDAARGPKPVGIIERLFVQRYVPLLGAAARGEVDAAVRGVIDAWRTSFERSYTETFASLRVTGKRPPMVFDAPDLAARLARQSNARAVKLVLVDAMRFDIGERLDAELTRRAAGKAVCVERSLLWAALPTTTPTQLALLARGADGLRDDPVSESEPDVSRARSIGMARRERIGGREIMKIDLIEAKIHTSGEGYERRVNALATELADVVERILDGLAPRTLLYVFGDHGFRWSTTPDHRATLPATQGGASPEEVLVPAISYLVGGIH